MPDLERELLEAVDRLDEAYAQRDEAFASYVEGLEERFAQAFTAHSDRLERLEESLEQLAGQLESLSRQWSERCEFLERHSGRRRGS